MAILRLTHNTDEKIKSTAEKIFDLEFLLEEAPSRLESYRNTLDILKLIKRGLSKKEAVETYCMECCPPGLYAREGCEKASCPACWMQYIDDEILVGESPSLPK